MSDQDLDNVLEELLALGDDYTFLTGAGISVNAPSNLPSSREIVECLLRQCSPSAEFPALLAASKTVQFEQLVDQFKIIFPHLDFLDYFENVSAYNLIHLFLAHAIRAGKFVITMNFDYLIEHVLLQSLPQDQHKNILPIITESDFKTTQNLSLAFSSGKLPVVKLHGSKRNIITGQNCEDSVVTSTPDLFKKKQAPSVFSLEDFKAPLFNHAMADRTLIVMGYSGDDVFDVLPALRACKNLRALVWIDHRPDQNTVLVHKLTTQVDPVRIEGINPTLLKFLSTRTCAVYLVQANTEHFVRSRLWRHLLASDAPTFTPLTDTQRVPFSEWVTNNTTPVSDFKQWYFASLLYLSVSDFSRFLNCSQRAIAIADKLRDVEGKAEVLSQIGIYYYVKDDFSAALKHFEEAHKLCSKIGNEDLKYAAMGNIAKVLSAQGKIREARKRYQEIYKFYAKQGNDAEQALMLNNIGVMDLQENNYNEALSHFINAKRIAKAAGIFPVYVSACSNLGLLYQYLNGVPLAFQEYNEALAISDRVGDLYGKSQILFSLGQLNEKLGDVKAATETLEAALVIDDQINAYNIKIQHLRYIAELYAEGKGIDAAVQKFCDALELANDLGDHEEIVQCYGSYGLVLEKNNLLDEAISQFLEQSKAAETAHDFSSQILALDSAGRVCRKMRQFDQSIVYLSRAYGIAQEEKDSEKSFIVLNHIGETYFRSGNYEQALTFYEKTILPQALATRQSNWIQQARRDIQVIKTKLGR